MDSKDIVRLGYDKVSFAYRDARSAADFSDYACWISELVRRIPHGAAVLDLGCGCGVPAARTLAEHFDVTGVDISPVQIERARELVPAARFVCADMVELDFAPGSFAAILSLYSIIHVPLEEQPSLFCKLRRWLQPGGYLLATVGSAHWTGTEDDWLGVPGATMYWSHADTATYRTWLSQSGFAIWWTRFISEGEGGHTLLLAQAVQRESEGPRQAFCG